MGSLFSMPEQYRRCAPGNPCDGTPGEMRGIFVIPHPQRAHGYLIVIASIDPGYEHVSARTFDGIRERIPTWDEMCFVKDLFWHPEAEVYQIHPPKSEYINEHPCVLHLWRPVNGRKLDDLNTKECVECEQ